MPRFFGTRANDQASSPSKSSSPGQSEAGAAGSQPANPSSIPSPPSRPADQQQAKSEAPAPPPGPDPAKLAELDDEIDQLSSRAIAVGASLDNLQRRQNAQGFGLRGDILEAQQLMHAFLAKAQSAVRAKDIKSARKYLDMTQTQTEKIEQFLGR